MPDTGNNSLPKKTPLFLNITRGAFLLYGIGMVVALSKDYFPPNQISYGWVSYLVVLYVIAEQLYTTFRTRGIDLSFAFPLLFSVYMLNFTSIMVEAQEKFPLLNRVEHFASFVLITYVVWVFFLKYLPHNVWHDHPYYTAVLVFSVVAGFGVINEIVELVLDQVFRTHLIGTGRFDTSLDLLMNSVGSGAFLAVELMMGLTERSRKT